MNAPYTMNSTALSRPNRVPANEATTAMAMSDAEATNVVPDTCRTASTSRIVSRLTASAMTRPRRIGRAARAAKALFMRNTVTRDAGAD